MVDDKYIPAPSDPGAAPQTRGVFYCPSGNEDPIPEDVSASVPPDRVDDRGASVVRRFSTISNVPIDLWYGINGEDSSGTNNSTTTGTPCRRIQQRPSASDPGTRMTTMDMVKKPSETVMFFDGVLYNHTRVNANRVNARHGRKTQTNIGFFDGHAETFLTKDLPGGLKATTADFALSNLQAKYPRPLWLLEQQY
jgi:prepilin-type processing-associated H-X9-DG protein